MFDMVGARGELAAEAARLVALPCGEVPLEDWADLLERTRALTNAVATVQAVAVARVAAFEECDLTGATFLHASLEDVDFRTSQVVGLATSAGLAGAIVDPLQLLDLAPLLARDAGIRIED